ncbi:hypothetical protein [Candidatus Accumulibacter meliphilus]|jgi:hypothetical protein|uniref:hypothetical protein n=1 Tax=Candidatus Accumulibacter meliphilus TaxID=2211374 RepID=UPI003DA99E0F
MLSDLARAITGEIMCVDGGLSTTALGNADPLPGYTGTTLSATSPAASPSRAQFAPVGPAPKGSVRDQLTCPAKLAD